MSAMAQTPHQKDLIDESSNDHIYGNNDTGPVLQPNSDDSRASNVSPKDEGPHEQSAKPDTEPRTPIEAASLSLPDTIDTNGTSKDSMVATRAERTNLSEEDYGKRYVNNELHQS